MAAINGRFWSHTFVKSTGLPYAGVRVFHYAAGTTTNLDVFTDAALTTAAAQPVVGDNSGVVSFYGSNTYRLLVKSSIADGDLTLYDFDGVELVHHTATLRAEDRGTSLPSITAAHRGRLFATVDGGGDVAKLSIVKTASTFLSLVTLPQLSDTIEFNKGANIASTTNVTLGTDGNFFDITGTTNIESFSSKQAGAVLWTRFTGTGLTLIHNATSFILPNGMNYRTQQNETCVWLSLGSGNWLWLGTSHDRSILVEDARTATVNVPVIIGAVTTGTPAAGIGIGQKFQAESGDESPSDFGQIEFAASDVTAASEDTYFQVLLRVAGAALTACYRWVATGAFKAIFTHANSADRTYTLQNSSDTLVGRDTTDTLTNKTLAASSNQVSNVALKTATGSASLAGVGGAITMNDYSFFPNVQRTNVLDTSDVMQAKSQADDSTTTGRFNIKDIGGNSYVVRWRYVTASDDPTIWVVYDPGTGDIKATWTSDDPTPNDEPGVSVPGMTSEKFKAQALTGLAIAQQHLQAADARIAARGLNPAHRLYRAIQVLSNDDAPSGWLAANCKIQLPAKRLVLK